VTGVGDEDQGAGGVADLGARGIGISRVDLGRGEAQADAIGRGAGQGLAGLGQDQGRGVGPADVLDPHRQHMAGRQHDSLAVQGGDRHDGRACAHLRTGRRDGAGGQHQTGGQDQGGVTHGGLL